MAKENITDLQIEFSELIKENGMTLSAESVRDAGDGILKVTLWRAFGKTHSEFKRKLDSIGWKVLKSIFRESDGLDTYTIVYDVAKA